jgi:ribonuclease Z
VNVTFLGTSAAWPSAKHNNVCFVAHNGDDAVLFECGPSILHQLAVAGIEPVDIRSVIVSHIHADHSLGIPSFQVANLIARRSRPVTICLPESAIEPMLTICLTVHPFMRGFIEATVHWQPLSQAHEGTLELPGGVRATTTLAEHGVPVVSTHAYFDQQGAELAFSGDTGYCERVAHNASGTSLLIHESNWSVALKTQTGLGHSTAQDAGRIAALAGAKRLALVHTDRTIVDYPKQLAAEAAAEFKGGEVLVPADFTTIDV